MCYPGIVIHIDRNYIMMVSPLLEKFKRVRDDLYNFRCPYCGDSKKFQNKARGFLYRKKSEYFYRCHNCDVGTNLTNFIKFVSADLYKEYVIENLGCVYSTNTTPLQLQS